jgi:hypothetical protein
MAEYVTVAHDDGIAIITLDNPPVNAMSLHLRQPFLAALEAARDDDAVEGIVIACAGRTFVSGADISEFGTDKAMASPNLPELCTLLEQIAKPSVAGWSLRSPATTASPTGAPGSACPRSSSAFCPAPAARCACRASPDRKRRSG